MEQNNGQALKGKRVAVLMTDGVEQIEVTSPRSFLQEHGATVTLISPKAKGDKVQGFNHADKGDSFAVDMQVGTASPSDFDALLLPGGVSNPDALRLDKASIDFIRAFGAEEKPIAAICHGPWTLIDAGIARAKHMTSWPSLQNDLRNAGAEWSDEEVVIDGRLVTSRKPDDLPAFNQAFLKLLAIDPGTADRGPSS
ncbi:type 1 glutamine amidotransferase [Massilia sp. P8910]|uniref:type 1 glutamine amidotransferase domain-containing protein n=1 Tax=Massilia antarctica TaxID=2765360 RepID=UPI0006BB8407|nr:MULTISPECIES: type 1 glutamine amidotransferase domain-containing protein [Massilia]MCE3604374.1 type 1 glutamine amidotransferase [Massilia antarctica]MCY0914848.1 type 1 glutamine amidotransferase [Massilia sp. H27-R4]CUI08106.1 ThiJ/PfpI family protein [Janthinobacterium sp. CG23_2]CUU31892.1 ThiJ/PfpI family protein [Janthinobacterium sp. CG23_2]